MYDYLKLGFELPGPVAEQALADAPALAAAVVARAGGTGGPQLRADYRGLRIDYWPAVRRGRIRGSLQSFAYGHNAGPFPPAAVAVACRELAAAVGLGPDLLRVQRLEVGLNLALPTAPGPLLELLTHHKGRPFLAMMPPARAPRPLEFVAFHHNYRVKLYDKGTYTHLTLPNGPAWLPLPGLPGEFRDQYAPARPREALLPALTTVQNCTFIDTLPPHLLRLEAVYLRARALMLPGLPAPLTIADLATPATMAAFAGQLARLWTETQHRTALHFPPGLTPNDAALLVAGASADYWAAIRPTAAPATYQRARARYRQLSAAQGQHVGPHPVTPVLEAALRPWLAPNASRC